MHLLSGDVIGQQSVSDRVRPLSLCAACSARLCSAVMCTVHCVLFGMCCILCAVHFALCCVLCAVFCLMRAMRCVMRAVCSCDRFEVETQLSNCSFSPRTCSTFSKSSANENGNTIMLAYPDHFRLLSISLHQNFFEALAILHSDWQTQTQA